MPSGCPFPEALREQLLHEDVGVVLVNLDFLKNHAPLAFNISCAKTDSAPGPPAHRGRWHVIGKRLTLKADGLLARECVEVAANRIISRAMFFCCAERERVPLKSMCSTKWEMPLVSAGSQREPT